MRTSWTAAAFTVFTRQRETAVNFVARFSKKNRENFHASQDTWIILSLQFHEDPPVDDPPAENKLCQVTGGNIVPVPED